MGNKVLKYLEKSTILRIFVLYEKIFKEVLREQKRRAQRFS